MIIDANTSIQTEPALPPFVEMAVASMRRDLVEVTGRQPRYAERDEANQIRIGEDATLADECYRVEIADEVVTIQGSGLGMVFGIYHFSTHHLGIDPYAAWTGVVPERAESIELAPSRFASSPHPVRHRGWFINDEDCLRGVNGDGQISLGTWQMIFETMLRNGWNMVIPGTGIRPKDPQLDLADRMGLWVAQHHSEPLGARLYSEQYRSVDPPPHPLDDPERYEALYRTAIDQGAKRSVIWTVGLRGQGDEPFSPDLPLDDQAAQGAMLGSAITAQKQLVEEHVGTGQRFVHYLYSESAELHRDGQLSLDPDVLPVWSDNGFGAMRVRRNWGPEPNVPALPAGTREGAVGVYYHVSFHDLQASSLLVPHVHPADVAGALASVAERARIDFFVLNVGNIRPHLFAIDLVTCLLTNLDDPSGLDALVEDHLRRWTARYFSGAARDVPRLVMDYYDAAFRYGDHHDERAGDELYHNTLRRLTAAVIKGEPVGSHLTFMRPGLRNDDHAVLEGLLSEARRTAERLEALDVACAEAYPSTSHPERPFFWQSVWMPVRFMRLSATSFVHAVGGLIDFLDGDFESTFRKYSRASSVLEQLWEDLTSTATGRWHGFYRGEWLVDVRETRRVVRTMQGLAFILGDTGHREVSEWTVKAFGLGDSLLSPTRQASTDYDHLGWALDDHHAGDQRNVRDLLEHPDGSDAAPHRPPS